MGLRARCSQGHDLERLVILENDAQEGLRVSTVGITNDGNLRRRPFRCLSSRRRKSALRSATMR